MQVKIIASVREKNSRTYGSFCPNTESNLKSELEVHFQRMISPIYRHLQLQGKKLARRSLSVSVKSMPGRPEIGILSLDAAPVNSLTQDVFLKITAGMKELESNSTCEVVLLTSSCRVFSAGLDLKFLYGSSRSDLADYWSAFQDTQRAIFNSRLLTVAAMNGHSMAGGCILALCCDERILSASAKIGLNEASFGIVAPPFSAAIMTQVIGPRLAERALTLGTVFSSGQCVAVAFAL